MCIYSKSEKIFKKYGQHQIEHKLSKKQILNAIYTFLR